MADSILPGNGLHQLRERIISAREKYERGELRESEAILEPFAGLAPIQRGNEQRDAQRMKDDPYFAACSWIALAVARLRAEIKTVAVHPVSVDLALSCAEFGLSARLLREAEGRHINAKITKGES